MSSCILSLLSPVLRLMVCGNFSESSQKEISLVDVEAELLLKLLKLACGQEGVVTQHNEELLELGQLADRLQMEAVRTVVEHKLSTELRSENCLEMIQRSEASGLHLLQNECYKILRDEFEVVSQKQGFVKLSEETIGDLLEEDGLGVIREEDAFKALARWMANNDDGIRREGLLKKIRYGVMSKEFLTGLMSSTLLPGHHDEVLNELVREAIARMQWAAGTGVMWDNEERLCRQWNAARANVRIIGADVLKRPVAVAVNGQGRILVSDVMLDEIIIFNRDGSVEQRIGSRGSVPGQFNTPIGIVVDQQGHIIVADKNNHRIQVLNANGSVACCFGSQGSEIGQLDQPKKLAIDREGHILVADIGSHRIQVFDADGSVVRHFGSRGTAVGQFDRPAGVAVDGGGRIAVVDCGNHRVQVFNGDGSMALCFGAEGGGPGQLRYPEDVRIDSAGRFVVADRGNHRIQVFNSDGTVARVIGSAGDGVGELRHPFGVVVDGTSRFVVVEGSLHGSEFNNHRVQVL